MDRKQAIEKAEYVRIAHVVINAQTGSEVHYEGPIVSSHIDGQKVYADWNGNLHNGPRYRRSVTKGPSIALAKKACRGLRVVVERKGENLRAFIATRLAASQAKAA